MSMPSTPTSTGAATSVAGNPRASFTWKAAYAPSVKSAPCAKLMTPIIPKMMDSPSASNTYNAPSTSPLRTNSARTAGVIGRGVLRERLQPALALGLRDRDRLQRFAPRRHLRDDLEDVPLVPPLRLVARRDDVHRLEELVVPRAKGERPALEPVHRPRQRVALERLDELRAVRALGLLDRLRDRVDGDVVAVRLVVGRAAPALDVARRPRLALRRGELVPPDDREVAAERLADGPRVRRIDHAARDLEGHPRFGVLLEEVRDVGARQVVEDEVGLRRLHLGDVLAEVRRARGCQIAPDLRALVRRQEISRHAQQVVAERVVGGEEVPAADLPLPDQPVADGADVLGVAALGREDVAVAALAPDLVGVGAGVDHEDLRPLHLVADREARRRGDEALDRHDPVLLDQLPRLLHRHARVGLVLGDQLDLAAEDAALFVQLFDRERGALLAVLADRAEEARERDELPDADGLLRPHDGGEREVVGPGRGAGGGEREEVAAGETGRHVATSGHRVTS